ncbi:hypothetical protein [Prosthecobacter sp.]|uniref:hypothetical protein n=1 Tax=Prosthecobacter sp. TaxID=1965333 RepID=UPI00378386C3
MSLLLSSCQSPKVTVVVNRLKPEMLKGRTVGVEGMNITTACWPGKFIEEPILNQAGQVLQHQLKGAHVYVLNENGALLESVEKEPPARPQISLGQTPAKEPDYIFQIMLRANSVSHTLVKQSLVGTGRLWDSRTRSGSSSTMYPRIGAMRAIDQRVLKAEYLLSDSRTHQLLWKAEAESSKLFHCDYRNRAAVEAEAPFKPLWIAMNAAAVKSLRK